MHETGHALTVHGNQWLSSRMSLFARSWRVAHSALLMQSVVSEPWETLLTRRPDSTVGRLGRTLENLVLGCLSTSKCLTV